MQCQQIIAFYLFLQNIFDYNIQYKKGMRKFSTSEIKPKTVYKEKEDEQMVNVCRFYSKFENKKEKWTKTKINEEIFQLPSYYEIQGEIGSGSYGLVILAKNRRQNKKVAIKKMIKTFDHKVFAKRILRQLRILRLLKHQNIINIETIILPSSFQHFTDIYVVFPVMDFDLKCIIKSPLKLGEEYSQFYIYQILRGLKYIHSAKILHRDVAPQNLLIDDNNDLKICDFGLSRFAETQQNVSLTDYVITRWYRAPEILLGCSYTDKVDIWGTGCILAEICTKNPFLRAKNTKDQLKLIISTLDFEQDKEKQFQFDKMFDNISPEGLDLLKKMLKINPNQRITAQNALKHPYFKRLHFEEDEPNSQPINQLQFEFQSKDLTLHDIKVMLYEQILLYHFEQFKNTYKHKLKQQKYLSPHTYNKNKWKK